MGEFILREKFEEAGLGEQVVVDSAGTTSWEVGNPADRRTLSVLERNGHEDFGGSEHIARQFEHSWLDDRDLILAADSGHLSDLRRLARTEEQRARIRLFREFDDRKKHSGLEQDAFAGAADMHDVGLVMEQPAEAMPAEIPHHAHVLALPTKVWIA